MPRRSILSASERDSLLALPDARDELIRYYTFSEADLSIIRRHRWPANRPGFAVQLCYLRFGDLSLGLFAQKFRHPPSHPKVFSTANLTHSSHRTRQSGTLVASFLLICRGCSGFTSRSTVCTGVSPTLT